MDSVKFPPFPGQSSRRRVRIKSLKNCRIIPAALATYVRAAALSTFLAPIFSSPISIPLPDKFLSPLADALNSTGRVTR